MEWRGRRQSGNLVDRRGAKTAGVLGGGGIIMAIIYALFTGDPSAILNSGSRTQSGPETAEQAAQREYIAVVLADTEDVWNELFNRMGRTYQEPKLVLFSGRVDSACGMASSAVGPFYCPRDKQVYIDLDFFGELQERLGAEGDFATAYVVAHEIGHHVQNQLGLLRSGEGNAASVRTELMADCFAGVWARHTDRTKGVLEKGDIEEALGAASAVGDDRLQRESQGHVVPDSFTHGSSADRMAWFNKGFTEGVPSDCDTSAIAH